MLWLKAWLETKWRFKFCLGISLIVVAVGYIAQLIIDRPVEAAHPLAFLNLWSIVWLLVSSFLAGTGIRTQHGFLLTEAAGIEGSTQFTLSCRSAGGA
jgi:cytochrome c oxidase assembly factor CtaG